MYQQAAFCLEELLLHQPSNPAHHLLLADTLYTLGGPQNWRTARSYYSGGCCVRGRDGGRGIFMCMVLGPGSGGRFCVVVGEREACRLWTAHVFESNRAAVVPSGDGMCGGVGGGRRLSWVGRWCAVITKCVLSLVLLAQCLCHVSEGWSVASVLLTMPQCLLG